jgi:(p)ppGpp synthase/HD superfamily hydrolase
VLGQRRTPSFVNGLPQTRAAVAYARDAHEGQRRKVDDAPFIAHPLEVASLLYYAGAPDHVIAAGILHDVIEKTPADAAEVSRRFGPRVATLVVAVSEDETVTPYRERKAALREHAARVGEEALMVLAADKVSKARELQRYAEPPRNRPRRVAHYRECLWLLQRRLPGSPLVRELEIELARLPEHTEAPRALAGVR